MEKELPFDFAYYHKANSICIRPISNENSEYSEERDLCIIRTCTAGVTKTDEELEKRYYNGEERIYFYDIKICNTVYRRQYKKFIHELLRRGKDTECSIHISNDTIVDTENNFISLYTVTYLLTILKVLLTIETNVIVEISNKTTSHNHSLNYKKVIDTLDEMLYNAKNVRHYMIREEVYKKVEQENGTYKNEDDYDHILIEVKKFKDGAIDRFDVINK